MAGLTALMTCLSCGGNRWKYLTQRSDLREDASSERVRAAERRPCADCAGTGVMRVRSS